MNDRAEMRLLAVSCLLACAAAAHAAEGPPVDFIGEIKPIFEEHCYECHGETEREGGLRLTNRREAFLTGDLGVPVIEPGHSDLSPLYELITAEDADERMPNEGPPLTTEQIELIRRWIDEGAAWPDDETARHWAYLAPTRPVVPAVENSAWVRNEIDRFVLARLERENVAPSPRAEPARLLRRVHLDLIGLPPTPEQIDAFVADPSPEAYDRVVEDLLASPRYGERWAVHWLDLARYADSTGFQRDRAYEIWPYRDWVIDAFNEDKPFDEFTIEQFAGDLLPDPTTSQLVATGFHRATTTNLEAGVDAAEDRVRQVVDRVNVTSTVWLGSTIECAQCHNHKYDPFSQREFYELFAFLNNTPLEVTPLGETMVSYVLGGPTVELPHTADQREKLRALAQKRSVQRTLISKGKLSAPFPEWKAQMRKALREPIAWQAVEVLDFYSSEDEAYRVLEDQSIVVEGPIPDMVVHEIRAKPRRRPVTALRLEILPSPAGPAKRPIRGRLPPVLSEVRLSSVDADHESTSLDLWVPDREMRLAKAIDGYGGGGWRLKGRRRPKEAVLFTEDPAPDGDQLIVELEQQFGDRSTVDRMRISTTDAPRHLVQVPEDVRTLLTKATHTPDEDARLRKYYDDEGRLAATGLPAVRRARRRIRTIRSRVLAERGVPRQSFVLKRGNFLDEGPAVAPGTPEVLHAFGEKLARNRLGLARWLVDPANPLVARVVVNRWWGEFFGREIVRTPEDFGTRGDLPTHPALLDWLAVEFVEGGWSMKSIHRKIVQSAAYQQSSRFPAELREKDPLNTLLARNERRRLKAEFIRDNALTAAGLLSAKMGGPPTYPPQPPGLWNHDGSYGMRYQASQGDARFRRGVYVVWRRSAPYPSFVAFDAPDRTICTVRRSTTNTPIQALTLMNDQAYVEMSAALAQRIVAESSGSSVDDRVRHGMRLVLGRMPRDAELAEIAGLYQRSLRRFENDPVGARELLGSARVSPGAEERDAVELAAWFTVASVLLNLDETISRS